MADNEPFTKKMRKATQEIHNISDALINAKLGLALSNNQVWAEGLLVFYEIFKFLEDAMDRLPNSLLAELDIEGMRCAASFEQDLIYYLGENWKKNYVLRLSVKEYLAHLKNLELRNPNLLLAYVYHLYMGLLSGGQILKKKRALILRLTFSNRDPLEGLAVVDLKGKSAYKLKKSMTEAMNRIADWVDEETRQQLIEESKMVFILNNRMVHSIEGTNKVLLTKLIKIAGVMAVVAVSVWFFKEYYNSRLENHRNLYF